MCSKNCMVMTFKSKEDFEVCNKFMNAGLGNLGVSSEGSISVLVSTENILVPYGTLAVKTHSGKEIQIKVTSGVAEVLDVLREKDIKDIDFSKY